MSQGTGDDFIGEGPSEIKQVGAEAVCFERDQWMILENIMNSTGFRDFSSPVSDSRISLEKRTRGGLDVIAASQRSWFSWSEDTGVGIGCGHGLSPEIPIPSPGVGEHEANMGK
jgi:hypothetical protein